MRVAGLLLLGFLAFAVTLVFKFPAAGVLPHVNIQPLVVTGVSGSVWRGQAQQLISPLVETPVTNINWKFLPQSLLQIAPGMNVTFDALGGHGNGDVQRELSGKVKVTDGVVRVPAKSLHQFLPLPVAEFDGVVNVEIAAAELVGERLSTLEGRLVWRNATITGALNAKLGKLMVEVYAQGEVHRGKINNSDGELEINGEFELDRNGVYKTDIKIKPTSATPAELAGMLGVLGRRASDGSYRVKNNGNIAQYL